MHEFLAKKLPIDCPRQALEALGATFGKPLNAVFYEGALPPGWRRVQSGYPFYVDLYDAKERFRGHIFCKIEPWEQTARLWLTPRYVARLESNDDGMFRAEIMDWGTREALWTSHGWVLYGDTDKIIVEARRELTHRFPDHGNVLAYWEDSNE